MSLKNVVKVMNFHALLRVDRSRREAVKYSQMEQMVLDMLDNILHNRNVVLDSKALQMDPKMPQLHIILGSDLGFCGNLNNLVRRKRQEEAEENSRLVIVGRKLKGLQDDDTLLFLSREDFSKDHSRILDMLTRGLRKKEFSSIRLTYNHYRNASEVEFVDKVIFPMPEGLLGEKNYNEDFVCEGDMQELLLNLAALYLHYELEIAARVSVAAENIMRQNITTESLHKIDELEEIKQQEIRRERKDKEFSKVLENFTRLQQY